MRSAVSLIVVVASSGAFAACAAGVRGGAAAVHAPAVADGLFGYDRAAPLELSDSLELVEDGVARYRVAFASPAGGHVTGRLFVPQHDGRKPGIVTLYAGGSRDGIHAGRRYAERGAVVLSVDHPFARQRKPYLTGTPSDSAEHVRLIVELRRSLDVLVSRGDVDPLRLAFVGESFGGAIGVMFAAVDHRPVAVVLQVADGGMIAHASLQDGSPDPRSGIPPGSWTQWKSSMRAVEGIEHVHDARPGTILFQNAQYDESIPVWKAEALHRAAGESHEVIWYRSGHDLPPQAFTDHVRWLAGRIGLREPSS